MKQIKTIWYMQLFPCMTLLAGCHNYIDCINCTKDYSGYIIDSLTKQPFSGATWVSTFSNLIYSHP